MILNKIKYNLHTKLPILKFFFLFWEREIFQMSEQRGDVLLDGEALDICY